MQLNTSLEGNRISNLATQSGAIDLFRKRRHSMGLDYCDEPLAPTIDWITLEISLIIWANIHDTPHLHPPLFQIQPLKPTILAVAINQ